MSDNNDNQEPPQNIEVKPSKNKRPNMPRMFGVMVGGLVVALVTGTARYHSLQAQVFPPPSSAATSAPQLPQAAYGGIGAALNNSPEGPVISGVFPGSPAALAGLKKGDLILFIDGKQCAHMSVEDATQLIRGKIGTTLKISFSHGGAEPQEAVITRAEIKPEMFKGVLDEKK